LHGLKQRKCNFDIAFFDDHAELCIPSSAAHKDYSKYSLARQIIFLHLRAHSNDVSLRVTNYTTLSSDDFQRYIEDSGMYFFMSHDGASPAQIDAPDVPDDAEDAVAGAVHALGATDDVANDTRINNKAVVDDLESDTSDDFELKTISDTHKLVSFRKGLYWLMARKHSCALINGLKWKDTKVMAVVLDGTQRVTSKNQQLLDTLDFADSKPSTRDSSIEARIDALVNSRPTTEEDFWLLAICAVLQIQPDWSDFALAFLVHKALMKHIALPQRRLKPISSQPGPADFLRDFNDIIFALLKRDGSRASVEASSISLVDLVDGQLFNHVVQEWQHGRLKLSADILAATETQIVELERLGGPLLELPEEIKASRAGSERSTLQSSNGFIQDSLLSFSDPTFNHHLRSVRIDIDETADPETRMSSARVFREATHWHNTKPLKVTGKKKEPLTPWETKKRMRALGRQMAEMTSYAASLTNNVGKVLEPEIIIVGAETVTATKTDNQKVAMNPASKKNTPAKSKAQQIIEDNKAKKKVATESKSLSAWQTKLKQFGASPSPQARYLQARAYLSELSVEKRHELGAEVKVYLLSNLLELWITRSRGNQVRSAQGLAALLFDVARSIASEPAASTKTIHTIVQDTCKQLSLPTIPMAVPKTDRPLAFSFKVPTNSKDSLNVSGTKTDFQLSHCGPYLDRAIDATEDSRVKFTPDAWQVKVLDEIDANRSVFVVAPTSAGKTFISFYAMKKVLQADDNGVLVYVAPTKALVNQIAAEIQAGFRKNFDHGGKSVWAIHTRDHRLNSPTGCQILVTVPHVLQIMLLSPSNARSWAPRVKRIIFDEIHSIGQAEDGLIWEQLLLLAPCPIICLSATVGNPQEFESWLTSTQKSAGFELTMVKWPHRYSDLRKFIYNPPKNYFFDGLPVKVETLGTLGLDNEPSFLFMHPVSSLTNRARGVPEDLSLEARDCLTLYNAMKKHARGNYSVPKSLDPSELPAIIQKKHIIKWSAELMSLIKKWMADMKSPFEDIVKGFSNSLWDQPREELRVSSGATDSSLKDSIKSVDANNIVDTTLPLLSALHAQDALPAILFNYDRSACEAMCAKLMDQLEKSEAIYKGSSTQWKSQIAGYRAWQKMMEVKKAKAPPKKVTKKKGGSKDDDDDEKGSKLDMTRDGAEADTSPYASFDPDAPVEGFHFANRKVLQPSELAEFQERLRRRYVAQWLCDALNRGIGVHHAGMNRAYRQVVETLFRRGFLRVVIATGTLALGLNMPCKTTVFSGDSVFLTALNYRQAAGRAGRRGFDLLGNVVFQNISTDKVCRLVSSRLPDLNGHFPITTSLILRLFILLHESKDSSYARNAINSLLSQPRLFLGGPSFKDQVLHHLRFSIEYLRRQHLLDRDGAPLNFAGCVSHLYFTENSSFAFHALLKDGFFHNLCAGINDKNEPRILQTLMLTMAHLFGRHECRQADAEVIKRSPSLVFLPRMPAEAEAILRAHNAETLSIFAAYVRTFARQHCNEPDNKLPLTGMTVGGSISGDDETPTHSSVPFLPPTTIRSAFAALSGHTDTFTSISSLCSTARAGVFLEEAVIPHVALYPVESSVPLNAYLYDFYRHGSVVELARANGVRRGDVWFLLNDFSLVLATVVTSLRNFMGMGEMGAVDDMIDVAGGGDRAEDQREVDAAYEEAMREEREKEAARPADFAAAPTLPVITKRKDKAAESWEDEASKQASDDETESASTYGRSTGAATPTTQTSWTGADSEPPAWEGEGGRGLLDVLRAFERLKATFDARFKEMWA